LLIEPCRLCLKTKELQDSHLIPAAFYKLLGPNPVVVNPNSQGRTSKQVRGRMLCGTCEHRFNLGGENWVLKNFWRSPTRFRLRDALLAATPVRSTLPYEGFAGASTPGVDVDKIAYFGASIFWRACLPGWRGARGYELVPLVLGTYEDELRLFLLGERSFPDDVALVTALGVSMEVHRTGVAIDPWTKERHPHMGYEHHRFVVPGICFDMFTGRGIPTHWRELCTVHSPNRLVHRSPDVDMWIAEDSRSGVVEIGSKASHRPRRKRR
jgi:hypothetical protein